MKLDAKIPAGPIAQKWDRHKFEMKLVNPANKRKMGLSMRRLHRSARVARTIADLEGSDVVRPDHLDEALIHRPKEVLA